MLAIAGFGADRMLKSKRHPGLSTFVKQLVRNYPKGFAQDPETIAISIDEEDLAQLERVVEEARARGVILPEGNSYVPARIDGGAGAFEAKVRIKGKLTDHVEGKKWSLRVIAKKDGGFKGMRRFSLQHPGTRNYLCDWFYHRLMQAEGVAALRYGFVRVRFNDDDLGIYAYEEHFGPELLQNNGRADGPIFRFDPALFWEHRLNEMNKVRFDEPFAAYQAASLDAFGSSDLEKDKRFRQQFEEAVGLFEAFRRGRLPASQVFDADRIARHHAILDLVGGHHSMDWSDVKFYFDPVLKRIEPVSYESFSAHAIRTLAGSNKYTGQLAQGMDLHAQWFNDKELFRSYVRHLERVSRKAWLDSAFVTLGSALDSASATVYREFPYKELDRSVYYKNQQVIRKLLAQSLPRLLARQWCGHGAHHCCAD
ncbi:MAG TPA: CotH kinase family protein [Flavobacteriales bacterium]|nr:CotH kinase family protein [Flavobacteriales bacterium]